MRLAALTLALAGPVAADEAAIVQAWQDWVAEHDIGRSALAVAQDGRIVATHGIGMRAIDPVPLASLSKAITGACVLSLIEEGRVQGETPLKTVFGKRPELLGQGAAITIDALLTDSSGLDYDRTQTVLNPALWGAGDLHDRISALALGRTPGSAIFFYNNENYSVLGSVIMEVTGQSVEDACAPRVLQGLDTAGRHGRTGGGLAWNGWQMTVVDYARFAATLEWSDDWPSARGVRVLRPGRCA